MITETYINKCFSVCFNKYSQINKNKELLINIKDVVNRYKKINSNQFPTDVTNKANLLLEMLEYNIEGKTVQETFDMFPWENNDTNTTKYSSSLKDFLQFKMNEELSAEQVINFSNDINVNESELYMMEINSDIIKVCNETAAGGFGPFEKQVIKFKSIIEKTAGEFQKIDMMNIINSSSNCSVGRANIENSNTKAVLNTLEMLDDVNNKLPSGYNVIDKQILNGGFRKKTVYVIAGAAKSGKSTFMNNILLNAAKVDYRSNENTIGKLFIYISLENELHEAIQRTFCREFNMTAHEFSDYNTKHKDELDKRINDSVKESGNVIDFCYKVPRSFSVQQFSMYIDQTIQRIEEEDGIKVELGGLYVDYLMLLDFKTAGDLRIQLSDAIVEMKQVSIQYNIPIITATQLNRASLSVNNSYELNTGLVAESHGISANVDGLFLMAIDPKNDKIVHFNSGVQRSGRSNVAIDFNVNFEKLSFESGVLCNEKSVNLDTTNIQPPNGCIIKGIEKTKTVEYKPPMLNLGDVVE